MRSKLFILGTILLVAFMMVLSGCDTPTGTNTFGWGTGTGTVNVYNISTHSADNYIYIDISDANNPNDVLGVVYIARNQYAQFTNVPTGKSLKVWIKDGLGLWWSSAAFTLSNNQTKTFNYDGVSIY